MSLNAVKTEITVDGNPCDFEYMTLDQSVSSHHVFEIAVSYRHEKQSVWAITVDEIFRTTLNKPVSIKMTHIESGEVNEFEGIVTDIQALGLDGDKGTVVLRGGSPTILLDRDPSMDAFVDYTLYNVVSETLENTAIKVNIENKPELKQPIPYIARYRETSYAFLSRVLASYGEWFYYDGKKLIVGRPGEQKEIKVTFDVELSEVRSMAKMLNLNTKYYDYNPEANNHFVEDAGTINNASLFMKASKQVSDPIYPTAAILPTGRAILDEDDMTSAVRVKKSREYVKMSKFKAKCKTCAIRIGEVAIVALPQNMEDVFFKDLGAFLVTEVKHSVDKDGHYGNTFTGIAGVTETLPDDHIVMPQAFQEPAIVTANDDPKNQGRVKVRFFWQPESESSNWIRVQTPDAGKSEIFPRNRGFVFIPETDDHVMIGYQDGDPSRPYVMGSLFHRDNTKGAAEDNTIKTISTKSGHVIEFNDSVNAETIKIKDKNANEILFDTRSKTITVSALEQINLVSKTIHIDASEDFIVSVGRDMQQSVGNNFTHATSGESRVSVGKSSVTSVQNDYEVSANRNIEIESGKDTSMIIGNKLNQNVENNITIASTGGKTNISSKGKIEIKSNDKVHIK
ncbi:type VI secretion system Vgr family protein [Bacteroides sp. 224]|uniref:type VI secretion system Vgr family protein n=1 Tax=Bacteroides sp. 224 TaxID=2302936 RepID=UPI0013D56B48|nr:phage baseplate assembly protein V [Bacteroides sp. 224]NDV64654.1 type VI secretion system spike protein VgrG [Bacteroides sp. 224]